MNDDHILTKLMEGNDRYVKGEPQRVDVSQRRSQTSTGQSPEVFVLSCIDSRVPVEMVFDQNIGDLFVGRVAGNVVNADQLGSMEFAVKVVGVKVILVMGHEGCGAVKGACDEVELGNLTGLLRKITPAIQKTPLDASDPEYLTAVAKENVQHSVEEIRKGSPLLKELEAAGELKLAGAYYHLESGQVELLC